MDLSVEDVKHMYPSTYHLEQTITAILHTFRSHIVEAAKNGEQSVKILVPTNFAIPSMKNATAQTIIYSRLIKELELKGFTVSIEMGKTVLYTIKWDTQQDAEELDHLRVMIASRVEKRAPTQTKAQTQKKNT